MRTLPLAVGLAASVMVAEPAQAADRPRLAVVLVVDQLSMGQLERADELLGPGGFTRLLSQGAVARDARYLAAPTVTAHGHATLATGAYASRHGIVANDWWEPEAGHVHVGHDPRYRLLTRADLAPRDATAPTQLLAPTLADMLKLSHPGSRVAALSLKDRGAILVGGARPDAAIWFDKKTDRWTTSSYYAGELPAWVPRSAVSEGVEVWNRLENKRFCALAKMRQEATARCAEMLYGQRAGSDADPDEGGEGGLGATFPHRLVPPSHAHRGAQFFHTPLADEALYALAATAVDALGLGQDDVPDLLTISASAFDAVGHDFGPESQESLDALLRIDRALEAFLDRLDAKVGKGRYVVALAADHGSRPASLRARRMGLQAGRFDSAELVARAERALDEALGPRDWLGTLGDVGFSYRPHVLDGVDRSRADEVVMGSLRGVEGVAAVHARSLFTSQLALRGDAALYARSYFDGRSPDFIVQTRPLWNWDDVSSHGSPYASDQRIPLLFHRGARASLAIHGTVEPTSLAPTLASILGVLTPAGAEGAVLTEVVERLR